MATTETVACKFVVKETKNGTPFLTIKLLGKVPLMLVGNLLCLHFWRPQSLGHAQAVAQELNDRFERLSIMHFTSLDVHFRSLDELKGE
jgi:hypothetical protein